MQTQMLSLLCVKNAFFFFLRFARGSSPRSNEEYNLFWHVLRIIGFCLSFANSCANPVALYCVSGAFRKHFNRYVNDNHWFWLLSFSLTNFIDTNRTDLGREYFRLFPFSRSPELNEKRYWNAMNLIRHSFIASSDSVEWHSNFNCRWSCVNSNMCVWHEHFVGMILLCMQ